MVDDGLLMRSWLTMTAKVRTVNLTSKKEMRRRGDYYSSLRKGETEIASILQQRIREMRVAT